MSSRSLGSPAEAQREFRRMTRRWRVRCPVSSTAGLTIARLSDHCFEPWLAGKGRAFIDPALLPQDGDMVAVAVSDAWMQRVRNYYDRNPAALEDAVLVDGDFPRAVIKLLRVVNGESWLVWNEGAVRLERIGELVGVVRHIEQDGRPILGSTGSGQRWRYVVVGVAIALACYFQFVS